MQNPYNVWGTPPSQRAGQPPPSIYGALPSTSASSSPNPTRTSSPNHFLTFTFTSLSPSVVNCIILGPNNFPQFQVLTDSSGYTLLKSADLQSLGLIEWKGSDTEVELRGIVAKQRARDFLSISSDQKYRVMHVNNTDFIWISESNALSLYLAGDLSSTILGRLTRTTTTYILYMTNDAIKAGLLHPALLTTILLQSGQSI